MHSEAIRVPCGQKLIRQDEAMDGRTIALTQISAMLFGIHFVTPAGNLYDEKHASTRHGAEHLFERRLMGRC
jgi:hypothetical protein